MHVWFTNRIKNSHMVRYRRGTENMYKIGTKKSHDHVWYPTMIKIKTRKTKRDSTNSILNLA